ncbi:alpha/beta hydrolase family protein [Brachybacterium epidermidis]|uniref:alpha/beta hydrolase family protein n=1 Tax=Brachybacterium epidermidis TaxID=2781983 RepID=UPI00398F58C7
MPLPWSGPHSRALPLPPRRAQEPVAEQDRWGGTLLVGGMVAAGMFTLSGGLLTLGARIMARLPLVPQQSIRQRRAIPVRAVHADRVHLDAVGEATRDGYLALRQAGGAAHVRLGPVTSRPTPTTVARPLLASDGEEPLRADPASVNGFYWSGSPRTAHGFPTEEVEVDSPVGRMPAWLVRPDSARAGRAAGEPPEPETWAILVHGHGATRGETLRLLPLLRTLGLTSLAITYRNDTGAPPSADRMHHLGSDEWEDAEAAVEYALAHGAQRIVLVGWSMGGGIALRTSVRSAHRERITTLVLDSPAVDWHDILGYHAASVRAPIPMRRLAMWMITSPIGARAVRLREPLALHEMRPEYYGEHLTHPTLLLHAMDDATVPPGPSRTLASLRPDLVQFIPVEGASHTREWNLDPARYERIVARHLVRTLELQVDVDTLELPVRDPAAPPLPGSTGERV